MNQAVTYFAVIDDQASIDDPAGIVRRIRSGSRGFHDEALGRSLRWQFTPLIVEWERAESTDDLVEVSEAEAERIIERLRERWSTLG
jgi:hypothetical protein